MRRLGEKALDQATDATNGEAHRRAGGNHEDLMGERRQVGCIECLFEVIDAVALLFE